MPYTKTWQDRIERGVCVRCGNERGPNGTSWMCRRCARYQNRVTMRRKYRLIDAGLCVECTKPTSGKTQRCLKCGLRNSQRTMERYRQRKAEERATRQNLSTA